MASLLPRGIQSPTENKPPGELPSPSEDVNATVTKLLEQQSRLEEKVEELEGDKRHFQNKLEEYIRFDREGGQSKDSRSVSQLERQISELLAEKADLQSRLSRRDDEIADLYSSQPQAADRGHRAHLLQRLNDLQASMQASEEQYGRQIDALKLENSRLREQVERLRTTQHHPQAHWNETGYFHSESWRGHAEGGRGMPPSWETAARNFQAARNLHSNNTEGLASLPESLSSRSSGSTSGQTSLSATLTEMSLTPTPPPPPPSDTTASELKKLKKQLEKYKTANIDLDEKLKDAKLELRKYSERGGEGDVRYRMDYERLRSENAQLRSQLDRALSESNHLRSLVSKRY